MELARYLKEREGENPSTVALALLFGGSRIATAAGTSSSIETTQPEPEPEAEAEPEPEPENPPPPASQMSFQRASIHDLSFRIVARRRRRSLRRSLPSSLPPQKGRRVLVMGGRTLSFREDESIKEEDEDGDGDGDEEEETGERKSSINTTFRLMWQHTLNAMGAVNQDGEGLDGDDDDDGENEVASVSVARVKERRPPTPAPLPALRIHAATCLIDLFLLSAAAAVASAASVSSAPTAPSSVSMVALMTVVAYLLPSLSALRVLGGLRPTARAVAEQLLSVLRSP